MGLLGFIGNAGFSSGTFWWIAVIAGILGLILLISLLFGDDPIFFTKIFYGLLFVGCLVITVGAVKGYILQRQIEEVLGVAEMAVDVGSSVLTAQGEPQPQQVYQPQGQQGYQPQGQQVYQPQGQQVYQPQGQQGYQPQGQPY